MKRRRQRTPRLPELLGTDEKTRAVGLGRDRLSFLLSLFLRVGFNRMVEGPHFQRYRSCICKCYRLSVSCDDSSLHLDAARGCPRLAVSTLQYSPPPQPALIAGCTLFVDGTEFPLPKEIVFAAALVCDSPRLSPRDLGPSLEGEHGKEIETLLHSLLREGYLYPADD